MAKFQTPIQNSPYDPFAYEKQLEKLTGESRELSPTPIGNQDSSLSPLSTVEAEQGFSLLSNDAEALSTINETKAQNQSALELTGKTLYNIGSTILFETAKLPGYIGGLGLAAKDLATGEQHPIKSIVDNAWVNAFESMQEGAKELIPVHIQKSVQEGNLWDKVSSGQWWASTGADGIGFLLSMMLPGQALKTLGLGAKIGTVAETLGNNSKTIGKLFSKANILKNVGESGQFALKAGTPSAVDSFAAATLNTFAESSAEAANTFDNVKAKLIQRGMSEEEADLAAGNAASGVFKANMALLIGSNLLDEAWLWKGFSNVQKQGSDKILNQIFNKGVLDIDALKNLKGKGWKDALSEGAKNFGKQAAKEGFFEEGMQTSLQQYLEEGKSGSVLENIYGAGKHYFEDFLDNKELHESIFLGGILGGGMSVFQTNSDIRNYNRQLLGTSARTRDSFFDKLIGRKSTKEQKGFAGLFSDNYINNFGSVLDIAQKDAEGKPIFKDGKVVVDETKFTELAESKANLIDAHIKYDMAVAENDKIAQDALGDVLTFNYLQPFLQQEGGYQTFKEHIPQLEQAWADQYQQVTGKEATEEQRKQFTSQLSNKAEDFNKLYSEVQDTHLPERFVSPDNTQEYQDWKSQLFNDKINLGIQNRAIERTKNQISSLKSELGEITKEEEDKIDPVILSTLKFYEQIEKNITKQQPKLREEYLQLFTKEGIKEHYEQFKGKREKIRQAAQEAVVEEIKKGEEKRQEISTIDSIKQEASNNGYDTNDPMIILENEEGKRYSIVTDDNGDTFIYNEKGEKKKLSQKLWENLKLKVVPRSKLAAESQARDIENAREAKLSIIQEIVEYRENLYNKTIEELKESNEKIEQHQKELIDYGKKLESLENKKRTSKKSITEAKENIAKTESIIKELQDRIEHLNSLKIRYEALLDEYKLYASYLEQFNINFSELKDIIEQRLLDSIKSDSQTISNDIIETEKAIQRIEKTIQDINIKLQKAIELRDFLKQQLDSSIAFNVSVVLLLTKQGELYNTVKELLRFDEEFLKDFDDVYKNNGLREILDNTKHKSKFLRRLGRRSDSIAENIPSYVAQKYFGKETVTRDEVYNYIASMFNDVTDTINQMNINAAERSDLKTQIFETDSEIIELKQKLESLQSDLELQKLNKQYIVLEEINQEKIEAKYSQELASKDTTSEKHRQVEYTEEPSTNPEKISEVFAERQLGLNMYPVGGLNIMYEQSGKFAGFDVLEESGLPKQNPSLYQQIWYKKMEEIKNDLGKYKILLYKPKYSDSSDLEKQIGENNINSRSDSDLVAILVDENNSPIMDGTNYVFTSIWRPETLYGEKPRLAPDAFVQPLLKKIGVSAIPYKGMTSSSFRKAEQAKINKYLETESFTPEQLYNKALEEARDSYTNWYQLVIDYNNGDSQVYVKPEGVTAGRPLQRRDKNRKIVWGSITENIPFVKVKKGTGTDKLIGAKLMVTPRSGKLTLAKGIVVNSKVGDVVLVPNDETNIIPTKSRQVTDNEAMLVMYLMSLGKDSISLPKGISYKIGNVEIKDSVNLFYYQTGDKQLNAQLKNFSLLHSIINYGEKQKSPNESEEEYRKRNRGTIFVATKTKKIIYTDFDGKVHLVPISSVKEAFDNDNFSDPKVSHLLDFLKQKRFNVSQTLVEQNNIFPYPSLKKNRDTKGNTSYSVNFDTSKSYYEFLITGDNPVLSTNLVSDPNYPQFVQRNLYFNPNLITSAALPTEKRSKKEKAPSKAKKVVSDSSEESTDGFIIGDTKEADAALFEMLRSQEIAALMGSANAFNTLSPIDTAPLEIPSTENTEALVSEPEDVGGITSLDEIPDEDTGLYADKVYSPNELLNIKIKSGEIKQECK